MDFGVTYLGALGAGALSFLSPCVLPLVPAYLAFLSGVTLQASGQGTAVVEPGVTRKVFVTAVAFVLGFSTVFVLMGLGASAISAFIARYSHILAPLAGIIIILLGLHFLGVLRIGLLYREARFQVASKPASVLGAYVIGLAFAFGWTPCAGPVLSAVLATAATDDSLLYGASLLGTYAAGIGIPFLLAALFLERFLRWFQSFKRHLPKVEKAMGGFLIITGLLFVTGSMNVIGEWMYEEIEIFQQLEF
ncbi:cytochrome c biogenesis CcdA family protein [Algihabitans sp.]|uniref:cytochrome c biogenesis CcdA family protein n=1 Tax=Algihabitans sp. TaxID=2821514 RepID=UPI003BAAB454